MMDQEQVDRWLMILLARLKEKFGSRLLLVVHVGSWARDDAGEKSDIDVNVVLDKVFSADIVFYRQLIAELQNNHLACGFLGGLDEMALWPRYDLVAFYYGSRVLHGDMDEVLGELTRQDVFDYVMVLIANLNHAVRHCMIYDKDLAESTTGLRELYKTAFFALQGWYLLKTGEYIGKKPDLTIRLNDAADQDIIRDYLNWDVDSTKRSGNPWGALGQFERWSSRMFERMAELQENCGETLCNA